MNITVLHSEALSVADVVSIEEALRPLFPLTAKIEVKQNEGEVVCEEHHTVKTLMCSECIAEEENF